MMTRQLVVDCKNLAADEQLPWEFFSGKHVAISGATGLIGSGLTMALHERERLAPTGLTVSALVRDTCKARALFGEEAGLRLITWDAGEAHVGLEAVEGVDVIIHCANMTSSRAFVERPVEVIQTTVDGARALLDVAHKSGASMCLLSTMEVYGEAGVAGRISEDVGGYLDPMSVRSSYPEAKRLDEALCAAYASQYGTNTVVVRLAQAFGPGVVPDDQRVFAYFARQAMRGEDIVLLTDGMKVNSYLYTADAVSAVLFAVAKGERGRAYNAANDATCISVRDMACMVASEFGNGACKVRIEIDEEASQRFRKGSSLRLDTRALESLGWGPQVGLGQMYARMIADWRGAHV